MASNSNVLDGLYTFLTADSSFNTSIGGGASTAGRLRYGTARENDTLPYCVYQVVDEVPFESFDRDGFEMLVQFSIYDDEVNGPDSVSDIGDDLLSRLHGATGSGITITGVQALTPSFETIRGPFREEETWRLDVDFRILSIEPGVVA